MLSMTQVIEVSGQEDNKGFLGVCMVAAIFIARCKIGSEKLSDVRNEIKSALEVMPDGETKVPKSTLNRYILQGLTLARRLSYAPPAGAQDLRQDRSWLATVASEADASTADASKTDHVTSLAAMLKTHSVTVKVNGTLYKVPVTNANRITKLLNKPAAKPSLFKLIAAAVKKAPQLTGTEIATLQAVLKDAAAKVAMAEAELTLKAA